MTDLEKLEGIYGDCWGHIAYDPVNKIIVADVFGKRNQESVDQVVHEFNERTDDHIPLFTTDGHDEYSKALLKEYGTQLPVKRTGKLGRPRKSKTIPPPELNYVQVVKYRRKGRVVRIEERLIYGTWEAVNDVLKESPVSSSVNTSFVENSNMVSRHHNRRLTRKTISFSKNNECLVNQFTLFKAYHHFVKPNKGLRVRDECGRRRWKQRTPAMSAGATDHVWDMGELFHFKVPRV